ncbi:MAG: hypothetical protein EOM14_10885 [Clostridia bacterium]|nr:hypothetical protein [Clostridia bacterium]
MAECFLGGFGGAPKIVSGKVSVRDTEINLGGKPRLLVFIFKSWSSSSSGGESYYGSGCIPGNVTEKVTLYAKDDYGISIQLTNNGFIPRTLSSYQGADITYQAYIMKQYTINQFLVIQMIDN